MNAVLNKSKLIRIKKQTVCHAQIVLSKAADRYDKYKDQRGQIIE